MSDPKRLRLEYNRESFRKTLKEKLPNSCVNCGSTKDISYHHIVPLSLGGTNNITNIVPLCDRCHKLAHGSVNIRETFKPRVTGRKRLEPPKSYKEVLRRYVNGEIGRRECENALGLSKATKIQDVWYYKEFLNQNNILRHKNKVDLLLNKNECIPKGREIARIEFSNGKIEKIYSN